LRALVDLTHKLITKLDASSAVESVLAVVQQHEPWEVAEILLPDSSADRLKVYRYGGTKSLPSDGRTIPIDSSISGQVYRRGQRFLLRSEDLPVLSTRYGVAPWVRDALNEAGISSGCFLPLIHDGRVIGVMVLGTSEAREFTAAEIDYLQEVAEFVAAVLDNALRFDALNTSQQRLTSERHYTDEELRTVFDFEHIVGRSKAMRAVLRHVQTVAPTDSDVLVLGETGTGKELVARAIHDRSHRKDQPFIKLDCAAIPATLIESELFGHEKGAFTGAISQKLGRLEIADRGTVFLDEIGDLPLELQTRLLRVLQDRAFERLGSNRTIHLNVRVIAATNRDLDQMVAKGEFRADLYYRLKVFPIAIPPLRERPDDIPPLVWHYVHKYAERLKKTIDTIPAEAMKAFKRYAWPGNVRELQHFMERSVILTSGKVLQAPIRALDDNRLHPTVTSAANSRTMEEVERETILQALQESNWVVGGPTGAAKRLGLKRTTLASRIERLGISRLSPGGHGGSRR
jgi:formate hydrogenlyase transcriptional activator